MTRLQKQRSITTAATGTVVVGVFQTNGMTLSTTSKLKKISSVQQWNVPLRALRAAGYYVIKKWEYEDQEVGEVLPNRKQ